MLCKGYNIKNINKMAVIINRQEELEALIDKDNIIIKDDLIIKCNINIKAYIAAYNIRAKNIKAHTIEAHTIKAKNIETDGINTSDGIGFSIRAFKIRARNIKTFFDIKAWEIRANSIKADAIFCARIVYSEYCLAQNKFICGWISTTATKNAHFCFNNDIQYIDYLY
jgi:hypothetical protein